MPERPNWLYSPQTRFQPAHTLRSLRELDTAPLFVELSALLMLSGTYAWYQLNTGRQLSQRPLLVEERL
jgi:hypothetical protein